MQEKGTQTKVSLYIYFPSELHNFCTPHAVDRNEWQKVSHICRGSDLPALVNKQCQIMPDNFECFMPQILIVGVTQTGKSHFSSQNFEIPFIFFFFFSVEAVSGRSCN